MLWPTIHNAAFRGDVGDLRAELDKGVSPDLAYSAEWSNSNGSGAFTMTPLHRLLDGWVKYGIAPRDALSCLNLLLAAGANPNLEQVGGAWIEFGVNNIPRGFLRTPLQLAVLKISRGSAELFVARLLDAGADVNARGSQNLTALHTAARYGSVECAAPLIDAGANTNALSLNGSTYTPLDIALAAADVMMYRARTTMHLPFKESLEFEARRCHRVALDLLRTDARTVVYDYDNASDPYVRRVLGAGGFRRYERAHLAALTATFAPKFPALPTDAVRVVVAFCFHVGSY